MSRPLTLEQSLLSDADHFLTDFSPMFDKRLLVLEAIAAQIGGFDIDEYWNEFGIKVDDRNIVKTAARELAAKLMMIDIPLPLAISSLSREPISISEKKQSGAFYTDFRLARFVAEDCRKYFQPAIKVADIAAGSGILLAAIAELYFIMFPDNFDQWISECVYAFDLSEYALRGARIAIATHASTVIAIKKMCKNWLVCDSLLADNRIFPAFDIVVGNPPWGKVKLSLHSFVNKTSEKYHVYGSEYDDFDQEKFLSEKQNSLEYSKILKEQYSLLGDAEPDMYMAFLQKATSVLKSGGHLSYIVPAGLIRSLGTESLRRFLLSHSDELTYYLMDNKANFFEIDTRFKFVVVSQKKACPNSDSCHHFDFVICKGYKTHVERGKPIRYDVDELETIRPDLTIPECRSNEEKELFTKICSNGRSWKEEWAIDIAREVDMTNDRSHFHNSQSDSDIPVIEGRMIQQFRFGAKAYVSGSGRSAKWKPCPSAAPIRSQFFISAETLNEQLAWRVNTKRAGYCDIAGQTNERAMMTAVVPPGVVCGNKVPTIVFPNDEAEKRLYFFVGVTNSFVFDWLLRRVISTTVNYFLLFSLPMPNIDLNEELAERVIALSKAISGMGAKYYTSNNMGMLRAELDVAVAKAYGLCFADLELIMKDFPLLDRHQPAINGESRSTFTRDLFLSIAEKEFGCTEHPYIARANLGARKGAKAYIPTEMVDLSKGGTR